jgi:hypothetical protein
MALVRRSLVLVALLWSAPPAAAQDIAPACHPAVPARVTITPSAGSSIQATLLCVTATEVVIVANGQASTVPLTGVKRIETLADPAWDGAVKGAAVPLVLWLALCHDCNAGAMLRVAAAYGAIGAIIDTLDTNRTRIYDSGRKSVGWRWRF